MRPITGDRKARGIAQAGFRRDFKALTIQMGDQISGILRRAAGADGTIPLSNLGTVQAEVAKVVERAFVGPDGRNAYGTDGVTPLAPYPRLLNKWYVYTVVEMVRAQHNWMRRNVPDDILASLRSASARPAPIRQQESRLRGQGDAIRQALRLMEPDNLMYWERENPHLQRPDESLEDFQARIADLRIFEPNPLASYDPMHTWVDPNGYRLSDRIWRVEQTMRTQLDGLISDAIRSGMGAAELADLAERFMNPERASLRTKKPYGTDASFDAMRLARTEIARSANQAAMIAAQMNPYVEGMDVARSRNGSPTCPICPRFATIDLGGRRVRDPYPMVKGANTIPTPPFHPQCMDRLESVVTQDPNDVSDKIRAAMLYEDPLDPDKPKPYRTPIDLKGFTRDLLGDLLYQYALYQYAKALGE